MPPPPPFAMCRSNTSINSNNSSFYFAPQQPLAAPMPPCPASTYAADPTDPIDMMLAAGLCCLDRAAANRLTLRRLGVGRYEIDGRRVSLKWSEPGSPPGIVVQEDDVHDSHESTVPLPAYLKQAANVATSLSGLQRDLPRIARVPKEQRLTFADVKGSETHAAIEQSGNERCESMRIACEQARLREQAAQAYEQGLSFPHPGTPARSLPPPPGLPMPYLN